MPKGPITILDIQEAVDLISASGRNPSVAAIRAQLGRGSMTTIQRLRREMLDSGSRSYPEPSDAAKAAFTLIWSQAYAAAEEHYRGQLAEVRKQNSSLIEQNRELSSLLAKRGISALSNPS
jgi:hypothetical protein